VIEEAKKQGDLLPLQKSYRQQLVDLQNELSIIEVSTGKLDALKKVLGVVESNGTNAKINFNGTDTALGNINNVSIPDYANPNFNHVGGLFTVDPTDSSKFSSPADSVNTRNKSIKDLVEYANSFLDDLSNIKINLNFQEIELDIGADFVNEKYNYKNNILFGGKDIG